MHHAEDRVEGLDGVHSPVDHEEKLLGRHLEALEALLEEAEHRGEGVHVVQAPGNTSLKTGRVSIVTIPSPTRLLS